MYFANAGVLGVPGLEASDADWDRAIDVNLRAHIRAAQLLIPGWVERGEGYFVSTASAAGLLTQIGVGHLRRHQARRRRIRRMARITTATGASGSAACARWA